MSRDNHYFTLPSNASKRQHPNNKAQHYKVALPHTIELKGKWQVALTEIQYPNNWYNVMEDTPFRVRFFRPQTKAELKRIAEEEKEEHIPSGKFTIGAPSTITTTASSSISRAGEPTDPTLGNVNPRSRR